MQFAVPQFIEVESKVIGPISVRQFIILLVTAGLAFVWYELFSLSIFIPLGVITLGIGIVFAFAKVNSQGFHIFALSVIQTLKRPSLSVWGHITDRTVVTKAGRKDKSDQTTTKFTPKQDVSASDIAELSLIVDSQGRYSPEDLKRLQR